MNKGTITAILLVVVLTAATIFGAIFMDNRELIVAEKTSQAEPTAEPKKQPATPPKEATPPPKEETAPPAEPVEEPAVEPEPSADKASGEAKKEFNLILANASNPLPEDFTVETADVPNGFQTDSRISEILRGMISDADDQGVDLLLCSAYRTREKQTRLFEAEKSDYLAEGKSNAEAQELAAAAIAPPGTSEHETGLAVDIVTTEYQNLNEGFAETDAFKWLDQNAWKYGFILRYPKDKQEITGIMYESWHYRYVGEPHAKLIKDANLCLEEYLAG